MERQAGRMTLGRSVGARIPRAMAPAGALCSSARALQNPNFPRQAMSKPIALYLKIEARLEVEPEAFRRAEEPRQAQSRVGRDRSLTVHDLVDPAGRHAEVLRQTILSKAERLQKILVQHFARMHRTQPLHGHRLLLVVIDNLDFVRIAPLPSKTDPPLVVDANAVLAQSITRQLFEPVARRHTQVIQRGRCVELDELPERDSVNRRRQLPDGLPVEETLRVLVPEAADHLGILTRDVNSVNPAAGNRLVCSVTSRRALHDFSSRSISFGPIRFPALPRAAAGGGSLHPASSSTRAVRWFTSSASAPGSATPAARSSHDAASSKAQRTTAASLATRAWCAAPSRKPHRGS